MRLRAADALTTAGETPVLQQGHGLLAGQIDASAATP